MRERFSEFRRSVRRSVELPSDADEDASGVRRPTFIVGLGNPGTQYAQSRHNVGQWCVAELARRHGATFGRGAKIEVAECTLEGRRVQLARTRGYYNESGGPVAAELRRNGVAPARLLVVYDDLDLPVAQVRIRAAGGHGGNNGMRSIIASLGTQDFARIRIGIDRPYDDGAPVRDPDRVASWVLAAPPRAEREALEAAVARAADAIELATRDGIAIAMSTFNPR